jgi:Intracellular proteinase inhibitor
MRRGQIMLLVSGVLGLAALAANLGLGGHRAASAATLPPLPVGWPSTLQLGMSDSPGGAAAMKATTSFGFRYQYLAGGVNTGNGWASWNTNGDFVTYYIQDSVASSITPVFTYYQIRQSNPGASQAENTGDLNNLQNTSTMAAYWADLKLFYQKAGAFPNNQVVLHVEPDMWGYVQQAGGDNAASVQAAVASSGMPELAGFANNMSGFAKAVVKLRDLYAPNAKLGYHLSYWGTGVDPLYSKPDNATIDQLATRSAAFYNSLGANFDVSFAEFSDRDSAFYMYQYGNPNTWWTASDFAGNVRYLSDFSSAIGKRIVMWQIPLGNTKMLAENNTWGHYQDNRPEWLLDDGAGARINLTSYVNAGVVAFLFGGGAAGTTCACDADHDGITNPAPINGNTGVSFNADDDGGYFRAKANAYYAAGAMSLASGTSPTATPTGVATATPTVQPSATPTTTSPPPTATPTSTPPSTAGWAVSATASPSNVRAGKSESITASVRSNSSSAALVDIEVYSASGGRVFQQAFDNQSFVAGVSRSFKVTWAVPSNATRGTYTVKIGIFSPGWGSMYLWNNAAATFTVTR